MKHRSLLVPAALALTWQALPALAADRCENLISLQLPDTRVTTAQSIAAGSYQPPRGQEHLP